MTSILEAPADLCTSFPCQDSSADLFFSEDPKELNQAKQLCSDCPFKQECLAGALKREEPWGVWGGEILSEGKIVQNKRGRGRPRKQPPPDLEAAA